MAPAARDRAYKLDLPVPGVRLPLSESDIASAARPDHRHILARQAIPATAAACAVREFRGHAPSPSRASGRSRTYASLRDPPSSAAAPSTAPNRPHPRKPGGPITAHGERPAAIPHLARSANRHRVVDRYDPGMHRAINKTNGHTARGEHPQGAVRVVFTRSVGV